MARALKIFSIYWVALLFTPAADGKYDCEQLGRPKKDRSHTGCECAVVANGAKQNKRQRKHRRKKGKDLFRRDVVVFGQTDLDEY